MSVAGLRGTGDWGTSERPKNFRELILWRNPNGSAPLTALMAKARKQTTNDPEFHWWEEELNPIRLQVTGTVTTTNYVTVVIDSGDAQDLVVGDTLLVEKANDTASYSYEVLEVSTVTSSTQFEVSRGAAGTTAAAIPNDSFLLKIGSAFEEGDTSPAAASRNPTLISNCTQIFKTSYNLTGTARETYARTGDALTNDKKRKSFDHSVALEQAFMFGAFKPDGTGAAGKPKRYTGGLLYYLATYGTSSISTLVATTATTDDFLDAVYPVFDYNSDLSGDERIILAGNGALNYLNKMVKADTSTSIRYDKIIDVFGMKLQRWIIPQGTLYIKSHPLLNVNARYTNSMFVIDFAGIRYRPLRNRDTKADMGPNGKGIQANDADQIKGQWLSEVGVEFNHMRSMRYIAFQ